MQAVFKAFIEFDTTLLPFLAAKHVGSFLATWLRDQTSTSMLESKILTTDFQESPKLCIYIAFRINFYNKRIWKLWKIHQNFQK